MRFGSRVRPCSAVPALAVAVLLCWPVTSAAAELRSKPQLPVRITIEPVQKDRSPKDVRPGDIVELMVTGTALTDADEVVIEAEVQDGAELVSGRPTFRGKAAKGEPQALTLGVRVPAEGTGKVRATIRVFRDGRQVLKRETRYFLGAEPPGPGKLPAGVVIRKDAQGRDIVEY